MTEALQFSDRDWKREAQLARANRAVVRLFKEFMSARQLASIEGETVEQREQARQEYNAAKLLWAELEVMATLPEEAN